MQNRDAVAAYFALALEGNRQARVGVLFSGTFEHLDSTSDLGCPKGLEPTQRLLECALAAIGEYLDVNGLPPETPPLAGATQTECFSAQYSAWKNRQPGTDEELLRYLASKAYWAWRSGLSVAHISFADALRLGVDLPRLRRVAILGEQRDWTIGDESELGFNVMPTPDLLRLQHQSRQPLPRADSTPLGALLATPRYDGAAAHWARAQEFAHGARRDLANAAKESICAVESLARVITGRHSDTLGELIKVLKSEYGLNPALAKSLEAVWGFTNTWPGVRHGAPSATELSGDDARFVLDSCDAAIRLLLGIDRGAAATPA